MKKKASKRKRRRYVNRSAKTGRLVTKQYARRHPATTEREAV